MFDKKRWPNMVIHQPFGHNGISWFSKEEIERRQNLVQEELKKMNCDALIVQSYFPPATMGCYTKVYWLSGFNGYRNTVTLILPKDGELITIHGMKTSSNQGSKCSFIEGDDISQYIKGAKRLAYADMGQIGYYFYNYLKETVSGVEIVDFSDQIEHMMAVKSTEEIQAIRDTCAIQDRIFAAASTFLYPGRNSQEITADITRLLQLLGADPTLMPKILLQIQSNSEITSSAVPGYMLDEPDYRLKDTDFVRLTLETPGSGGYYSERARYFFFDTPHPEIQGLYDEALKLHDYQLSLYRPGVTMKELRNKINAYKESKGFEPMAADGVFDTEIRGIGMLTVDRPQIQYAWENIALEPGISIVSMAHIKKGNKATNVFDMCIITEDEPYIPGEFPLELVVL